MAEDEGKIGEVAKTLTQNLFVRTVLRTNTYINVEACDSQVLKGRSGYCSCFFTWTFGGVFSVAHAAVNGVKKAKAQEQQGKRNVVLMTIGQMLDIASREEYERWRIV